MGLRKVAWLHIPEMAHTLGILTTAVEVLEVRMCTPHPSSRWVVSTRQARLGRGPRRWPPPSVQAYIYLLCIGHLG